MKLIKSSAIVLLLLVTTKLVIAQGGYEDLLYQEVEVEDPVYMPVLGIGAGIINYYGELQNDFKNLIQGAPTYRLNVYQYIDNKHYWKVNLNGFLGKVSGHEQSYTDVTKNLNFETEIYGVGLNFEYSFGNIYKGQKKIVPFVSLGGEYFAFEPKTDIMNASGNLYEYYPDGTIRIGDQVVTRDYKYESNIRNLDLYGRGKYSPNNYSLVADLGFDFKTSDRVALRIASSLHYTFTDDLDGISSKNTIGRIGNATNDMFTFTYVSLNIDLFSSAKTKIIESLFANVTGDFDPTIIADVDRDAILDLKDNCLDSPVGVPVDSVGCPLDDDKDGVPNYMDKEQFSNKGAIVDEFGEEMSPDKIRGTLFFDLSAVNRNQVYMIPVGLDWTKYTDMTPGYIPEKFKKLDKDGDSYISFDELLDAINRFFDSDSEYNSDDIYDLNSFFFAQ